MRTRDVRLPTLLCLLAALVALHGCAPAPSAPAGPTASPGQSEQATATPEGPRPKVLLVGIDGATFKVIDPLVAEGRMPNLARLMREGAAGVLASMEPTRSPAIWTTIATGLPPSIHGIEGFAKHEDGREWLVNSGDRRVPAIWTIASARGRDVGVVGWWATWPAEPVDGWIVSDRLAPTSFVMWADAHRESGLTHPRELAGELAPLVMDPTQPPVDEMGSLVELEPAEIAEVRALKKPVMGHGLSTFNFSFCVQRTYERVLEHQLAREQPDLAMVLLAASDTVSHNFWHYYEPGAFPEVDAATARRLGKLIPAMYEHDDRYLGKLLEMVGDDTIVLVVSDHGFRATGKLPARAELAKVSQWFDAEQARALEDGTIAVGQSGGHTLEGIVVAWGPGIAKGVRLQASVLDVAPTVLALLGLPVARDLPGRVLEEALLPELLAARSSEVVASYRDLGAGPASPAGEGPGADEVREQLRALGYLK